MGLAADIRALEELVAEGAMTWVEAGLQLRADHGLTYRGLHLCGAAVLFQRACTDFQQRWTATLINRRHHALP